LPYLLFLIFMFCSLKASYAQFENVLTQKEAEEKILLLNDYFKMHGDEKIYFNSIYYIVTHELKKEITNFKYSQPHCLEQMIVEFANMYLGALRDNDYPRDPPLPWLDLFTFRGKPTTHLLLGMNAHISYDLPLSLYRISKGAKECSAERIKSDYFELNGFFTKLLPLLNTELKRSYRLMTHQKSLDNGFEEEIVLKIIKAMRREAWESYLEFMSSKNSSEFEELRRNLESKAHAKAVLLKNMNFLVPVAGY